MPLPINTQAASLDPLAAHIIRSLSSRLPPASATPAAIRQHYAESRRPLLGPLLAVAGTETLSQKETGGPALTIYRPLPAEGKPRPQTFLFLHGGGWTVGDLETYDALCRRLCSRLNANIVFAEYRLAPEHPFPAPLLDAEKACRFVFANAFRLGINPERVGVLGDSAGANLAAVLALRNKKGIFGGTFHAQVLIYPCLDLTCAEPSHTQLAEGYLLTRELYRWYVDNYLRGHDARDWHVSPLFARNLAGLAPSVVLHAGFDPLRDEAKAYVQRLREAKVPVKEISFPDMMHGFINMAGALEQADLAVLCIRASLHTLLSNRLSVKG
ncbi:MAG: alpha/beta hydrolase [Hyphomicrobiales bacterium]